MTGTAGTAAPERVRVELGERSYDVVVGAGILDRLGEAVAALGGGRRALVVADAGVAARYGAVAAESLARAGFAVAQAAVATGERSKSLRQAARLYDAAIAGGLDRASWVVAVGGGVVGDLAGFVAATLLRGVAFCQVPTTLLAQVDASVGGKVAVNHPLGKNLVGAFHQPRLCWGDVATLATLPRRELRCGLAEVIKHGVMADASYLDEVEARLPSALAGDPAVLARVVAGSVRIKAAVVAGDEREETGARQCLNLGHTVGQALEAVAGYGRLHHGEAVAVGLVAAGEIALRMGGGGASGAKGSRGSRGARGSGGSSGSSGELSAGAGLSPPRRARGQADGAPAAGRGGGTGQGLGDGPGQGPEDGQRSQPDEASRRAPAYRWDPRDQDRLLRLLRAAGLPTRLPAGIARDDLLAAMYRDKKTRAGELRWVLPVRAGAVAVGQSVPEETVREVLAQLGAVA